MTTTRNPMWQLALAAPWLLGACGDDGVARGEDGPTLLVATYNAGLARSFVDYAAERTDAVADALSGEPLDVLCLQEAWEQEDWDALADATGLPHRHRLDPAPGDGGDVVTCTAAEVDPLEACVRDACDVPPGELTSCALTMCADEVGAVSGGCLGCITGVIGDVDIDAVVAACGPGGSGGGSNYAYGGSFGTGILSMRPLAETDALVLESTTSRRALLYAQITDEAGEPIHLFCTHLTPDLEGLTPYTGDAGSWGEENASQVDALLDYVRDKAGNGRAIIMGDLNTGPALDGIAAELPGSYEALSQTFDNPYVAQADARCSFCPDNTLQGADASDGVLIDHVMLSGFGDSPMSAERFLDGEVSISVEGEQVETALSDHYGVKLTLAY